MRLERDVFAGFVQLCDSCIQGGVFEIFGNRCIQTWHTKLSQNFGCLAVIKCDLTIRIYQNGCYRDFGQQRGQSGLFGIQTRCFGRDCLCSSHSGFV